MPRDHIVNKILKQGLIFMIHKSTIHSEIT